MMRVTVVDYGAGNLHSLAKALVGAGRVVRVESDPRTLLTDTDCLVLPGVGSFGAAAARLAPVRNELRAALRAGLPCLGVCLGMQLLFERSDEGGGRGLGLLDGAVTRLVAKRVPQIGWNTVEGQDRLLAASGLRLGYFANSYACRAEGDDCVTAWASHEGDRFPAVVRAARTVGVQFHPEKSSAAGRRFVQVFLADAEAGA